jgi:hypothetical protein
MAVHFSRAAIHWINERSERAVLAGLPRRERQLQVDELHLREQQRVRLIIEPVDIESLEIVSPREVEPPQSTVHWVCH